MVKPSTMLLRTRRNVLHPSAYSSAISVDRHTFSYLCNEKLCCGSVVENLCQHFVWNSDICPFVISARKSPIYTAPVSDSFVCFSFDGLGVLVDLQVALFSHYCITWSYCDRQHIGLNALCIAPKTDTQ